MRLQLGECMTHRPGLGHEANGVLDLCALFHGLLGAESWPVWSPRGHVRLDLKQTVTATGEDCCSSNIQ
jgi:hypothetical protein